MVEFIDQHRQEFGVESICAELLIAPSTYHDHNKRPPSDRARRDAVMMPMLMALFVANYRVYGARKLWIAARRAGHDIGRDQVARLMKALDIESPWVVWSLSVLDMKESNDDHREEDAAAVLVGGEGSSDALGPCIDTVRHPRVL